MWCEPKALVCYSLKVIGCITLLVKEAFVFILSLLADVVSSDVT